MRALSTSSGSVIFVPDEIERKSAGVSYNEISGAKPARRKFAGLFGRRKSGQKEISKAA